MGLAWTVVGVLTPLLVGSGIGVLSLHPPDFRVARTCFWLAALSLLGMMFVWSVQTDADALMRRAIVDGLIGVTVCTLLPVGLGWVSRREQQALGNVNGAAKPQRARDPEMRPNVMPVRPIVRDIYLAEGRRFLTEKPPATIYHIAAGALPEYVKYRAVVLGFRNDAPTVPVNKVRAKLILNGGEHFPVTGCWLNALVDHTDLNPNSASQEVILAFTDTDGDVVLVDDRRGELGQGQFGLYTYAGKNFPGRDSFDITVELSSEGAVLTSVLVTVTLQPLDAFLRQAEPDVKL